MVSLLLSLSARSSRKKGAVGKSADRFTLSVLLERLSVPSLLRGAWRNPIYFIIGQGAVNGSSHHHSAILNDLLSCFFSALGNHIEHSFKNVLRPYSVNFLLHNLKIQLLIICIPLALHWIICSVCAKSDVRHSRMQRTCQALFLWLYC